MFFGTNIIKNISPTDNEFVVQGVLHQGYIQEAPLFTAIGDEFETFILRDTKINNSSSFISDNFFTVFVKETPTSDWEEWTETTSLFLESSISKKFEKRFNENFNYEFKFGNGANGKKLTKGAQIAIYYLMSSR